ncbi:MAG: CHAT domain-containing protein, partial [Verrucomicrobiota bacterium]
DRTELLLEFTTGLERVRIPVTAAQLTAEVRKFRLSLERRTTNQYLGPAQQLYTWLITPVRATLVKHQIETLVFVPDGALRTIPLAALHDGEHFLIEQFACAVSPGVALVDARPLPRGQIGAVAAGLSEATQNFAALPGVPAELQAVAAAFQAPVLLNQQFTVAALQKDFSQHQFQVVHFATHGQVDKDIARSFILTHDGRLTLDDLEALLRPAQFRGQPVELLTLSACQTAAGDDRAALGLAGVAIKAGARSAVATLWFVNDESTTLLMEEFYRDVKTTSKAKALQQAQLKVLRDPRFGHAGYWAAYLLIGNWL